VTSYKNKYGGKT